MEMQLVLSTMRSDQQRMMQIIEHTAAKVHSAFFLPVGLYAFVTGYGLPTSRLA